MRWYVLLALAGALVVYFAFGGLSKTTQPTEQIVRQQVRSSSRNVECDLYVAGPTPLYRRGDRVLQDIGPWTEKDPGLPK